MKRAAVVMLCAVGGYLCFAIAGYALINLLSSNMHDRSVEAAMTSVFVLGPVGSLIGIVVGVVRSRRGVVGRGAAR
jgi:hypothetical protein